MTDKGLRPKFYGVGVGPGAGGLIPVAAVNALHKADLILAPRARKAKSSVARECLAGLDLPEGKFREVVYNMDPDRAETIAHYRELAAEIAAELAAGKTVAYLTIGDTLTYSTYGYTLAALQELMPEADCITIPGITSFAAIAAAVNWPIGQGKERVLILPCPETAQELRRDIESHDMIVLMKIGARMPMVAEVIDTLSPQWQCAVAQRIGHVDQVVSTDLKSFLANGGGGYLTTMLIRRNASAAEQEGAK